jgi:putative Mn2+ efflux pump MntP
MGKLSILLIAAGAILTFTVNVFLEEVDLAAAGVILMAVGAICLIAAVMRDGWGGFRTERHVSADGRHVVEETHSKL